MSLSQEEKEQVAVLLGWTYYPATEHGPHALWHTTNPNRIVYESEGSPVTLEACMEYAKGKGWGHTIYWNGTYEAELFHMGPGIGGPSFADTEDQPDPLTAFVRALLKAEEASRPQRWTRLEETLAGPDNNDDEWAPLDASEASL